MVPIGDMSHQLCKRGEDVTIIRTHGDMSYFGETNTMSGARVQASQSRGGGQACSYGAADKACWRRTPPGGAAPPRRGAEQTSWRNTLVAHTPTHIHTHEQTHARTHTDANANDHEYAYVRTHKCSHTYNVSRTT